MGNVMEALLRHWQGAVRGLDTVDCVLRRAPSPEHAKRTSIWNVVAIVVVCGPIYGFAMGSYGFSVGDRTVIQQIPQMVFSGLKVPLLVAITVAISLPSFFVLNTLIGLRDDFRKAVRAIISAQAGLMLILFSLFPITLFCYASLLPTNTGYQWAVLINAIMFGLASVSSQILLRGYYRELIKKDSRHRMMVRLWIFVYAFVGIQAGYVLRPFIGDPDVPTTFFRAESFQNAYVKVFGLLVEIAKDFFS